MKRGTVCSHLQAEGRRNHPNKKDDIINSSSTLTREAVMSHFSYLSDCVQDTDLSSNFAKVENFRRFQLARKSITLLLFPINSAA